MGWWDTPDRVLAREDDFLCRVMALGAAQALYADFAPLITMKALSYFDDGDLGALPDEVKQALSMIAGSTTGGRGAAALCVFEPA